MSSSTCGSRGRWFPSSTSCSRTDWYSETDEILTRGAQAAGRPPRRLDAGTGRVPGPPERPGFATENNLRLFTTLIYSAQKRLSITSPYFVPDESLLYAMTTAAQRGVDVELFVSEEADQFMVGHAQCSYYEELLDAGVKIYLYPAPWILHSKHFSVDDEVAVIGSSNMDMRSFALNYEVVVMLVGGDVVARMRAIEDRYRSLSRLLTADEWRGRSRGLTLRRQRDALDRRPSIGETSRRSHDTGHNRRPRKSARRLGASRRRGVPVRRPDDARRRRGPPRGLRDRDEGRGGFPGRRPAVGSRAKPDPRDRAAACLEALGVTEHRWLGYADGGCAGVDDEEAARAIAAIVDEFDRTPC